MNNHIDINVLIQRVESTVFNLSYNLYRTIAVNLTWIHNCPSRRGGGGEIGFTIHMLKFSVLMPMSSVK